MSIVMGIDQHRAQVTAEWIELESGEISRGRVRPADREGVRRFLARFAGQEFGGGVGGDDWVAVLGGGAARGRRGGASG